MLPRWVFLKLYFSWVFVELRRNSEVAEADVAFAWGKEKDVTTLRVVLHMRNDFRKLFNVDRLKVHDLVRQICVIEVPKIDAEIVWWEEVFPVWAHTELINIIIVAVLVLLFLNTLVALADNRGLRKEDLITIDLAVVVLSVPAIFKLP